jgi:hypothetical protein
LPKPPGWVSRVLEKREAIERILGVPLESMYGCGHFGCVFESEPPWSVKITRDPTEGDMWATLRAFVADHDYGTGGIARVKDIVRLRPDISWRGKEWPLHAIVREEIEPLYESGMLLTDYSRIRLGMPAPGEPLSPLAYGNMQELRQLEKGLIRYRDGAEAWHAAGSLRRAYVRDQRRDAASTKMLDATNLMGGPIGGYIGETLTVLLDQEIILKDVHLGNIGWRVHEEIRGGRAPGHAHHLRSGPLADRSEGHPRRRARIGRSLLA